MKRPFSFSPLTRGFIHGAIIFSLGCGGSFVRPPSTEALPQDDQTGITQTLISLLEKHDRQRVKASLYPSDAFQSKGGGIYSFITPAGYRVRLRYTKFGMALVEALKLSRDPLLARRLIEMVQWSRDPEVRSEALVNLAVYGNPAHKRYFKEALLDSNPSIRFAAVEAIQLWNQPEGMDMLRRAVDYTWSPLLKVFAAQALLSMGDQAAIQALWDGMKSESWIIRAMSARYLGDFGKADDYQKLYDYFIREKKNDFVLTEIAISVLKLISQKGEKVYYSSASPGWKDQEEVKYSVGPGGVIEIEPLIIIPPRLKIPKSLQIATQINTELLNILRYRLYDELDPIQAADPVLNEELNKMVTPTGFALYLRYSYLAYLLVESLAGSSDPLIQFELESLAKSTNNTAVKSVAIVALSYNRDPKYRLLIQDGLKDKSDRVRMAAMESIEIGRFDDLLPDLALNASNDPLSVLRVYALQVQAKFGNTYGRLAMIPYLSDTDWPSRGMAFWYLGRYGEPSDYTLILSRLGSEDNPFVQAEICLSSLRLAPL